MGVANATSTARAVTVMVKSMAAIKPVVLVLLLLAPAALCNRLQEHASSAQAVSTYPTDTTTTSSSSSSNISSSNSSSSSSSTWPRLPVYDNPWTQQNIALVYAHQLLDGVGAQTMRMLELYAVAKSLNIGYLHRPIRCVGHVDGRVHFRSANCSDLEGPNRCLVEKLRRLITLPSSVTEEQVSSWDHKYIPKLGWNTLAALAEAALKSKQPLLISTEFATSILHTYPDMYLTVPHFQPQHPSARLVCDRPRPDAPQQPGRPYLLHGLRLAVHFRRGDIAESTRWADRMLSPDYFINVVKQIMQVLDSIACIFAIEVFTETPHTAAGRAELELLKQHLPGAVLLVSTDLAWSWQMLATADILVMSNSAFSLSAALLNPDGFNVFFPNAKQQQFRVPLRHWVTPLDSNGTLSQAALEELGRRVGHRLQSSGDAAPRSSAALPAPT